MKSNSINRRNFLKQTAAAAAGCFVVFGDFFSITDEGKVALSRGVIIANKDLCAGCRTCEVVCSNSNSGGRNSSALSRIILNKDYITCEYEQKVCLQCSEPPCLAACPTSALHIDKQSGTYARVIDEGRCIGCQQCLEACAEIFNPPRPRFDTGKEICIKCHLCYGDPQCVKFCPYGALQYKKSEAGLKTGYPYVRDI